MNSVMNSTSSFDREDLIKGLGDFGLSVNQAKVYLCIIQQGPMSVGEISAATNLHSQDIYKILPKLQKKGLITEKLGSPVILNAIPPEDALDSIISLERKKANENTKHLKAQMKGLVEAYKNKPQRTLQQDSSFILITGNDAVANRARDTSARTKKQHHAHLSDDLLFSHSEDQWRTWFRMESAHGVEQRFLIGTTGKKGSIKKLIEETRPSNGTFIVKSIARKPYDNYMVLDQKEAFIYTQLTPFMIALRTNNKSIIRILEENFEKAWDDERTETLYEQ
jgi:sugar-specific transcriptional regulator TrmB